MPILLDGKKASEAIAASLQSRIAASSVRPKLVIMQVGEREESSAYIERKKAFGKKIGAGVIHERLLETVSEGVLLSRIEELNADSSVHGILLQLPLPKSLDRARLLAAVDPRKDVDGLAPNSHFTPATARGILELLQFYHIPIRGKKAVVLGRSALVGTPTAEVLRRASAEVTVCHSGTTNTMEVTKASNIVVAAIGKPRLIGADYFRDDKTQVVVDVGITAVTGKRSERLEEEIPKRKLVGDVDFDAVKDMVAAISPVPGGVGPMTVAALFQNLVEADQRQTLKS